MHAGNFITIFGSIQKLLLLLCKNAFFGEIEFSQEVVFFIGTPNMTMTMNKQCDSVHHILCQN